MRKSMIKVQYIFFISNTGETDWKILVIDINDPLAEKLNGGWITLI